MKIEFNKFNFTKEECNQMKEETIILQKKNPEHVPLLILLKSNSLKIDKHKFLITNNIIFSDFIYNTLSKKLINLNENDTLKIEIVHFNPNEKLSNFIEIKPNSKTMEELYEEYKDEETNMLVFRISKNTTYKYIKNYIKSFF